MRFLFFYYVRRSVLFKNSCCLIEASKFFVFVFVGDHGKLFLKISQMQVVCICYCYNFHIFLRCGLERFNDGPGNAVMKEEEL